jgi:hypothetical protein
MGNYGDFQEFDFATKNPEKYDWLTENGITVAEYESMDSDTKEEYDYAFRYPEKYEFLKESGISYSDFKGFDDETKDAYDWAFKNPDKQQLVKAVTGGDIVTYRQYASALYDIKADKDANGKTISGSRKNKVADYINGLDIGYGEKIILFKSEYPSDDSYNNEIIEYLDSRADISYEEMVAILTELGFKVNGNTVTWD